MATLQLRDFPDDLHLELKLAATTARVPLRTYIIDLLRAQNTTANKPANKN